VGSTSHARTTPMRAERARRQLTNSRATVSRDWLGGDESVKAYLFDDVIFTGKLTSIPFTTLAPMAHGACVEGVDKVPKAKPQNERAKDY